MSINSSELLDRISMQLLVARLRGIDEVQLRNGSVVDTDGQEIFRIPEQFLYIKARIETLAEAMGISNRTVYAQTVLLSENQELSLQNSIDEIDLNSNVIAHSKLPVSSSIEVWKSRQIAKESTTFEIKNDATWLDIFTTLINRVAFDLTRGRLSTVEHIPGLPHRYIRELWIDVDVSILSSRTDAFVDSFTDEHNLHVGKNWRRLSRRASLFLDGLRDAAVIFGKPGSGKSTLLKWFASEIVLGQHTSHRLPVVLPLRQYAESIRDSPKSLFQYALEQNGLRDVSHASAIRFQERSSDLGVIFLLDGWDEVPNEMRPIVVEEIQHAMAFCSCVATSRPIHLNTLPIPTLVRIEPLSPLGTHSLISNWLSSDRSKLLINHLSRFPRLEHFSRNPFIATALCGIVESVSDGHSQRLPQTLAELYDGVIEAIRSHMRQTLFREFSENDIAACRRLAFFMFSDAKYAPKYDFERIDLEEVEIDIELFESRIAPSRLVFRSKPDSFSHAFLHPSVHEYLVAGFICEGSNDSVIEDRLISHFHNPQWGEVWKLLAGQVFQSSSDIQSAFIKSLRQILDSPDRFGLIVVRVAELVYSFDTCISNGCVFNDVFPNRHFCVPAM